MYSGSTVAVGCLPLIVMRRASSARHGSSSNSLKTRDSRRRITHKEVPEAPIASLDTLPSILQRRHDMKERMYVMAISLFEAPVIFSREVASPDGRERLCASAGSHVTDRFDRRSLHRCGRKRAMEDTLYSCWDGWHLTHPTPALLLDSAGVAGLPERITPAFVEPRRARENTKTKNI